MFYILGMSSLFIVCQSFKTVPDLYELIVCNKIGEAGNCDMPLAILNVMRLSHLLVCINSSANFLIYYLNGHKFRQAWLDTYGWCFGCKDARDRTCSSLLHRDDVFHSQTNNAVNNVIDNSGLTYDHSPRAGNSMLMVSLRKGSACRGSSSPSSSRLSRTTSNGKSAGPIDYLAGPMDSAVMLCPDGSVKVDVHETNENDSTSSSQSCNNK